MPYPLTAIKDLCSFSNGHGFTRHDWTDAGLPIIRIAHLNGSRNFDYFAGTPESDWIVEAGELLFAWAGTKGVSFGPTIWSGPRGVLNQHIFRVRAADGVDKTWLYYALLQVTKRIEKRAHGFKSTLLHVRKSDIENQRWPVPPLDEQRRVVVLAGLVEGRLSRLKDLLNAKRRFQRGLMQQLLTGQKRFPEFVRTTERQAGQFGTIPKDWGLLHIAEIAVESKARGALEGSIVYSCTKHDGLVPSMEYFGKQVFSRNLEGYKRLQTGDIAYATNHIEEGSIGLLREGMAPGLVSPMYTVFRPSENIVPEFLFSLLKTESYRRVFANRMSASVERRGSLRWDDFSRIKVGVPAVSEQRRVVDTLRLVDAEIGQLERLRELTEAQKRGLLSRLLSGEIQVPGTVPEAPTESALSRSKTTAEVA
jgi:type I restriction enzyme S subunit